MTSFKAFAPELAELPANFDTLDTTTQTQLLLTAKASDAKLYGDIRDKAIRCAPEK